jgi:anti-sigma factor RsiW
MAHDPYLLMISMSFDEMLSPEEQDDLNKHMRTCAHCAEMWSRMNAFDRLMSSQPMIGPSASFAMNVMRRVETYQVRRRWTPWMIAVLVVLSILASLSLAWPALFFALGMDKNIASWPITASIISTAGSVLSVVLNAASFATNALIDWLFFLVSTPAALAVVVAALVFVSTYIGMREGFKATMAYQQVGVGD